ncbi:MAG: hypothetical protein J7M18_02385 [Candidatus Eremiobacteraeota bacterium]|nr:hypothetical protein [Candidatus Eremiobacteraeota bacterium]
MPAGFERGSFVTLRPVFDASDDVKACGNPEVIVVDVRAIVDDQEVCRRVRI